MDLFNNKSILLTNNMYLEYGFKPYKFKDNNIGYRMGNLIITQQWFGFIYTDLLYNEDIFEIALRYEHQLQELIETLYGYKLEKQ